MVILDRKESMNHVKKAVCKLTFPYFTCSITVPKVWCTENLQQTFSVNVSLIHTQMVKALHI